jgi:nucleoside-diphosphate-sugar epimerase
MIVAITGASGFIGQNLCQRFAEWGATVRPILRRDLEGASLEGLFAGADVVVHAAGATRAPTRAMLRESNVALTAQVLDAARRANAGRFVLVSSQAAAGPASYRDIPVTEDMSPSPIEAYGRSKLDAETVLRESRGIPWTIVRPAAVYGPADHDFLAVFRLSRFGIAIHPGNREQWVSIIHVDDVAEGVRRASTEPAAIGGTFFLANQAPVQWAELFRISAAVADRRLSLDVEVPRWLVGLGAEAGDLVARITGRAGLLTTGKAALAKPRFWICSPERAARELGFTPRIEVREGFSQTYCWYRTHGWL